MIRGTGIDSTVKLYLKGNGANGSTKIFDDSQSHKSLSVYGNTRISTAQSKFGGSSIYFDGSGDSLHSFDKSAFNFLHQVGSGTGKWSIGFYVRIGTKNKLTVLVDTARTSSPESGMTLYLNVNNQIICFISRGVSSSFVVQAVPKEWSFVLNQWYYMLVTYDHSLTSNNLEIYIDGVLFQQLSKTANAPSTGDCTGLNIAGIYDASDAYSLNGYIDDQYISDQLPRDKTYVPTRQRG